MIDRSGGSLNLEWAGNSKNSGNIVLGHGRKESGQLK